MRRCSLSNIALALLALPVAARAEEPPPLVRTTTAAGHGLQIHPDAPDNDGESRPWSLTVGFDASVGTGTFVASRFADDPYYASTLSAQGGWRLDEDLTLSLALALSFEWTSLVTACHPATGPRPAGAPAQDCSGTNDPNGRWADLDDLTLSLSHGHLYELEGAVLSARGSIAAPTSRASRAATNLFTLGLGVGVERPFGVVTPSLSLGFSKYFPLSDAPLADAGEESIPIGRCRAQRTTSCILLAGFVPSWRFGVDVGLAVDLPGDFDASISFGYAYSASHGRALDGRSAPATDADGDRIVSGTNASDSTSGVIELGYAVMESMRVSLGVASAQPARTADNAALRFPFYDFISPANNYSAWYASVSWTL